MEVPSDIMTRYLARRKHELDECYHSLEIKNFEGLERVGHQLKGNGVTFGHPEISKIGELLEEAAIKKDEAALKNVLERFSTWVSSHPS